jgi:hypothetical protein
MTVRAEELAEALSRVQSEIAPYNPELIVVTKTYPISDVEILFQLGARNFGENRNEEGISKSASVKVRFREKSYVRLLRGPRSFTHSIHWITQLNSIEF